MEFTKVNALGNDFILIDNTSDLSKEISTLNPQFISTVCERSFGVGADGILVVNQDADGYQMVVYNANGTRAEMCGNGLRCVALYLKRRGAFSSNKGSSKETTVCGSVKELSEYSISESLTL